MTIQQLYQEWCKQTKRTGSVLVGGSIQEFFTWLDVNEYKVYKNGFELRDDEEIKGCQIKGYKYILP